MCKFYDIEEESRDKYSNLSLSRCPAVSRMLRVSVPRDAGGGRENQLCEATAGTRQPAPSRHVWAP